MFEYYFFVVCVVFTNGSGIYDFFGALLVKNTISSLTCLKCILDIKKKLAILKTLESQTHTIIVFEMCKTCEN